MEPLYKIIILIIKVGDFDDSGCSLISSLTTFSSNVRLYLKCKVKNPLRKFVAKSTKKDGVLQSFIFIDTKGDEIQATAFNKTVENISQLIQEGETYEIRKVSIQLAERAYNTTKCDYKLVFNESSQIIPTPDNGKFNGIKLSVIPLEQIIDFPIGKIVDVFGFVLEDKGFQEITTKNEKVLKMQKLIIADDTMSKIELTLWEPFGNADITYTSGDLIAVKNCRVREYNGKKTLSTTDSTEIKKSLDPESDARLRKFFNEHQNENEYKDIQGEIISNGVIRAPAELVFIKDIQNTFEDGTENKDRPTFEINATVVQFIHSDRNFYIGCSKCHKKMETDVCEKFLGIKGEDYEQLIKNGNTLEDNEGLISIDERIGYHTFSFVGKVRENIYNETKKYRFSVFRFNELTIEKRKNFVKMLSNLLK